MTYTFTSPQGDAPPRSVRDRAGQDRISGRTLPRRPVYKDEQSLEKACKGRRDRVVRAHGEMVDVLWKAGHTVAAIRLELLWNNHAHSHEFALLCGYSIGNFYKDAARQEIRRQHTHILSDDEAGEATVN